MRRFAIGDVHGCAKALRGLIEAIDPQLDDEVIFLGDYVDRGPDSRDCIEQIIELQNRTRVVPLRGNHELMLCGVAYGGLDDRIWLENGGFTTVASYGGRLDKVPEHHRTFLSSLRTHYETENEIFVHACYDPTLDMDLLSDDVRYWTHLSHPLPAPHVSGKRVFVGHTPQRDGRVLHAGHLVCLDTGCFCGGYLTAIDLDDLSITQVDRHGHQRLTSWDLMTMRLGRLKSRWQSMTGRRQNGR